MKKHIKPCNCDICEKARYWTSCPECQEGHPSFWKTVVESPQWKLWQKEQSKRFSLLAKEKLPENIRVYDMAEVKECGWISSKHFQDFIEFVMNLKK